MVEKVRARKTRHNQGNQILESGYVNSQDNMRVCMNENEAWSVWQDSCDAVHPLCLPL